MESRQKIVEAKEKEENEEKKSKINEDTPREHLLSVVYRTGNGCTDSEVCTCMCACIIHMGYLCGYDFEVFHNKHMYKHYSQKSQ